MDSEKHYRAFELDGHPWDFETPEVAVLAARLFSALYDETLRTPEGFDDFGKHLPVECIILDVPPDHGTWRGWGFAYSLERYPEEIPVALKERVAVLNALVRMHDQSRFPLDFGNLDDYADKGEQGESEEPPVPVEATPETAKAGSDES